MVGLLVNLAEGAARLVAKVAGHGRLARRARGGKGGEEGEEEEVEVEGGGHCAERRWLCGLRVRIDVDGGHSGVVLGTSGFSRKIIRSGVF